VTTPTAAQLVARRAEIAARTDGAVLAFERGLADVMRQLERQLRALAADVAKGSRTAIIKAARAARLRNEIRHLLASSGFDDLLASSTDAPMDRIARAALADSVGKDTAAFVGSQGPKIAALKTLALSDLIGQGDQVAHALWRATVHGVFSARPLDAILEDLASVIDRSVPQIRTLYDTSVSIYGREVERLQADEDPDARFAYLGPVDALMREFCAERVGKVYTRAEIEAMDNHQLPNVLLTGGGYNCRHGWTALSRYSELQDLQGTGERIPEVEQQLQALPADTRRAA
jgi:hypothetical protein